MRGLVFAILLTAAGALWTAGCASEPKRVERPREAAPPPDMRPDVSIELVRGAREAAQRLLRSPAMERVDAGFKIVVGAIRGPDDTVITVYGDQFGDLLLRELQDQSSHRFRPLARKRLLQALEAQRIEHKDLGVFFDEASLARLDRSLGADAVIVGDVVRLGGGAQIVIEVVDLETKELLASDVVRLREARGQEDLFRPVAYAPGSLEVEYGIFMTVPGGLIKLERDARMLSGSGWKMGLQAAEPCYAYVWQADSRGIYQALLPSQLPAVRGVANRIDPSEPLVFPPGEAWFRLDDNTGHETFFMVFARHPLVDLDRLLQGLPPEGVPSDAPQARQLRNLAAPNPLTLRGTATQALVLAGGDRIKGYFEGTAALNRRQLDLDVLKAGPDDGNIIRHTVTYRHD